ncbi:hypothetical protein AALP_AA6G244400 [Arabis alpina]|uniref:Uncharacterized protein n=1 Tax=Arabis alpina TaxID=50452 RepID=A0A087GRF5_ARAAL|nr:hypothetical protein AALP_AA6G244400 [Arabis alpina]
MPTSFLGDPTSFLGDPTRLAHRGNDDPKSLVSTDVPGRASCGTDILVSSGTDDSVILDLNMFVYDTNPMFHVGDVDAPLSSSSSSSSDSRAFSDDEAPVDEVEQTKKAKKTWKKAKVKVRPNPPGSSLSDEKSLQRISEEIMLVAPSLADRINPRGIRHLIGIYVLRRECGVDISTEHLSYLTDFRVRGRSDEVKHSVTNASGMALIAGFPSKDVEDHFFFVELSKKTVEAECIGLVKRRWKRRVKQSLPEVSKEFVTAMHDELCFGNGNWRKSFSRKRIERVLSTEILLRKILGRGSARVSSREQAALEAAAKATGSSGTNVPKAMVPMTSTPTALSAQVRSSRPLAPKISATSTLLPPRSLTSGELAEFRKLSAERARTSSGKGKGIDRETPSKRQRLDTYPGAVVDRETSASHVVAPPVGGLLHGESYSAVKSKASEKIKKDYDDKLMKLKSRCTKAEGEIVQLRGELSSASDLQRTRIGKGVGEARDEIALGFAGRTSEVTRLLAEIGGKVQNDMLNLAEIDVNLEFIGLLQGSEPPDLPTEVKALRERRHLIYDARDVFADLLASVRRLL